MDRLTGAAWKDASGSTLRSFSNLYSNADMITNVIRETGEEARYVYDSLDRLTNEQRINHAGQTILNHGWAHRAHRGQPLR